MHKSTASLLLFLVGLSATAAAQTGDLAFEVHNEDDEEWTGALCRIYDVSGVGWDCLEGMDRVSNGSGNCSWSGLAASGYVVEVFYDGGSPFPGEEFWGGKGFSLVAGQLKNVFFTRHQAWATGLQVRRGHPTDELLSSGSFLEPGETVWVGVPAKWRGYRVRQPRRLPRDRHGADK